MARSDLLIDVVEAERRGDKQRFKALVEGACQVFCGAPRGAGLSGGRWKAFLAGPS